MGKTKARVPAWPVLSKLAQVDDGELRRLTGELKQLAAITGMVAKAAHAQKQYEASWAVMHVSDSVQRIAGRLHDMQAERDRVRYG